jgi:hypothetical protein
VTAGGKTVIVDPALEAEGFQGQAQGSDSQMEGTANAEGTFSDPFRRRQTTNISQELPSRPTLPVFPPSQATLLTNTTDPTPLLLEIHPCRLNPHPTRVSLSCHSSRPLPARWSLRDCRLMAMVSAPI